MRVACGHLCVVRAKDLLDQDGTVRKLASLPVCLRRTGSRVGHVHLISLGIENYIGTKGLVGIAHVRRLANVSAFIDEIESIRAVLGLRPSFRISKQDAERKSD